MLVCSFLPSCTNDPDPGNKRLNALKEDPARKLRPRFLNFSSEGIHERQTSDEPDRFGIGPRIIQRYQPRRGNLRAEDLYEWYDAKLPALSWRHYEEPSDQDPDHRRYRKTIDNWCAYFLMRVRSSDHPGGPIDAVTIIINSGASHDPSADRRCPTRSESP